MSLDVEDAKMSMLTLKTNKAHGHVILIRNVQITVKTLSVGDLNKHSTESQCCACEHHLHIWIRGRQTRGDRKKLPDILRIMARFVSLCYPSKQQNLKKTYKASC